ncbi:MAG: sigma-70 family RNA polymerase sigma factor [Gemmatimonadota bacterium]
MSAHPFRDDQRLADLMRAAQDGDSTAYATLLTELVQLMRRIVGARRMFANEADVEDVVQEILISVHSVRATYDPGRAFMPWVLAIARNRIADAARRHSRSAGREVELGEPTVTFFDDDANTDEGSGDPEALARAIQELPAGQRQAIRLLKLQDMSLREASAATGMSEGALKVATHRAMLALRRKLTGD